MYGNEIYLRPATEKKKRERKKDILNFTKKKTAEGKRSKIIKCNTMVAIS